MLIMPKGKGAIFIEVGLQEKAMLLHNRLLPDHA
jgi:hypothetical protein